MELLRTSESVHIFGLDNLNDYYDVSLKEYRVQEIPKVAHGYPQNKWEFVKGDIAAKALINELFAKHHFDIAVNLAAQAGCKQLAEIPILCKDFRL
jgi:nucleoside-diphosphate-sugar epimerase